MMTLGYISELKLLLMGNGVAIEARKRESQAICGRIFIPIPVEHVRCDKEPRFSRLLPSGRRITFSTNHGI